MRCPFARAVTTIRTWGSTPSERTERFGCDDLVPGPRVTLFRAVDVDASVALTWRWVGQLRLAPYSHDLVDNLGRRSPRELDASLTPPRPGERVMTIFRIVAVTGTEMTLRLVSPRGRFAPLLRPLWSPAAVTYRVVARPEGGARIVVKYVTGDPGGVLGLALRTLLPPGDLVMMRRQLRTLARLAARDARR